LTFCIELRRRAIGRRMPPLSGAQARFAETRGRALRYQADVGVFFALPSEPSAEDWRDAMALVPPGTLAAIVHDGIEVPEPWKAVLEFEAVQMIEERVEGRGEPEAIPLGSADVREMLELVRVTEPGPFMDETSELGEYIGVRRDGALIAMAGERMHFEGWTEISAVCTAPEHRGQGLASRLVRALIVGIHARSEQAFLHVLATNTKAIRLYEALGFRVRRRLTITALTPEPSSDPRDSIAKP
jgi:ribosomal protein S18 acetylase RimI-like enzyme